MSAETVMLVGGPMDGWAVKEDAPALRPDWGAIVGHEGWRYVLRAEPDEFGMWSADWTQEEGILDET